MLQRLPYDLTSSFCGLPAPVPIGQFVNTAFEAGQGVPEADAGLRAVMDLGGGHGVCGMGRFGILAFGVWAYVIHGLGSGCGVHG